MTVLTLTTGTAFIMWLGEQITERGIGNGISLIIFSGIVASLPSAVATTVQYLRSGASPSSTRNASSAGASTAGRARISRSR